MKFIERVRKWVATKDAEIAKKEEEVRLLEFQLAEEMASLVAEEARLEFLRAEAAPTNVPVNVEAEFRDRRIASEFTRFKSKEHHSGTLLGHVDFVRAQLRNANWEAWACKMRSEELQLHIGPVGPTFCT